MARFPSLYLGSEGQGAPVTWINGIAAGERSVAAPAGARLAGAVRARRAAGSAVQALSVAHFCLLKFTWA